MSFLRRCLLMLLIVALPMQAALAAAGWHCAMGGAARVSEPAHAGATHAAHDAGAPHSSNDHDADSVRGVRAPAACCAVAVLPATFAAPVARLAHAPIAAPSRAAYADPWLATPRKPPRHSA